LAARQVDYLTIFVELRNSHSYGKWKVRRTGISCGQIRALFGRIWLGWR